MSWRWSTNQMTKGGIILSELLVLVSSGVRAQYCPAGRICLFASEKSMPHRPIVYLSLAALLFSIAALCINQSTLAVKPARSARAIRTGPVSAPADAPSSQASTNLQGQLAIDYLKEHGIYDRLSASIEQAEYEIDRGLRSLGERGQSDEEVYAATNRAQNLRAQFSGGEVLLQPSQADRRGAMKLRLKLQDYGYAGRMLTPGPEVMRVDGNRVEITREIAGEGQARREEITEWSRNRKEGIEQGFTLTAPPGEREVGQPLRVRMKVTGKVRLAPVDSGKAVER